MNSSLVFLILWYFNEGNGDIVLFPHLGILFNFGFWFGFFVCFYLSNKKYKIRMYLAEAVHTITLIRDIGIPNHLPYNSLHTAFCVPPQHTFVCILICWHLITFDNREEHHSATP